MRWVKVAILYAVSFGTIVLGRAPEVEPVAALQEPYTGVAGGRNLFADDGGIYLDWFSVNEGAAVGVVATGIAALFSGMRWKELQVAFLETAKISGFLFMILIGAEFFNSFLALAQLPKFLAAWITQSAYSPVATVTAMIVFYLLLSSVMDELAMILLTMPVFTPILLALNFGMSPDAVLVWFGILALAVVGIGLVAPPIGLNVFIIHSLAKNVSIAQIYRGVIPFVVADLIRLALLILIPAPVLWLPGLR
ncbi:MAG: TRAP transporter large permease subunit [Xanthobacteraceae bacterium]|nr:TRAP transporter large permease subunit [Xanthobacteraceae bacterium]